MQTLHEKKIELQSQFRSYDQNFNEQKDIDNYRFNKELEKEIKRIDIAVAMQDEEGMKPIKGLQEALNLPCAIVENEVCIEFNGGILHVIEETVANHSYLLFMSQDTNRFYDQDNYETIVETIIEFYIEKAKTGGCNSLILSYENLNNLSVEVDLEKWHFEQHEQDGEAFEANFSFIQKAPELFWAHLPRGFYIHWIENN